MATKIDIPKELLAQIDYENTINGGIVEFKGFAGRQNDGYRMVVVAPSVRPENIRVEAADQRFLVYYMIDVLDGAAEMPHYVVNLPLPPDVDVNRITANFVDGKIQIRAPFNDWGKGNRKEIDLDF